VLVCVLCVCVLRCVACARVSEQCSTRRLLTSLRHHLVVLADDEDTCGRTRPFAIVSVAHPPPSFRSVLACSRVARARVGVCVRARA
jgi:hypothetical protein